MNMNRDEAVREFVVLEDDPGTEFVIVEAEPADDEPKSSEELVPVPDAGARYPGLVPVESLTETNFVIVEEQTEETGFRIVEDEPTTDDGEPASGVAPDADVEIVPAPDAELVPADAGELVPAADAPDEDATVTIPDPFTPALFRPDRSG